VSWSLGNAGAPRWWDLDPGRLGTFLEWISTSGATAVEFVLHTGPADERTRRVHLLEQDWDTVFDAARGAGLELNLHASLDPRYAIADPAIDWPWLTGVYGELLRAGFAAGERQRRPVTLTVHACEGSEAPDGCAERAKRFLGWAESEIRHAGANLRVCVELRAMVGAGDRRPDRSRRSLLSLVAETDPAQIGICWDLAHDWQNAEVTVEVTESEADFLSRVAHVHLHDATREGVVHHPLVHGQVPWRPALTMLESQRYAGSVTLEIRYRHALAAGDPWNVLQHSYRQVAGTRPAAVAGHYQQVPGTES
jgi:sugar phosphate isomerase/epimerase